MADATFLVESARTGRSACKNKKCPAKSIAKGVLRIGRAKPNPFADDDDKLMTEWFHAPCWFDAQSRMRKGTRQVAAEEDLAGFDELDDESKALLRGYLTSRRPFAPDMAKLAFAPAAAAAGAAVASPGAAMAGAASAFGLSPAPAPAAGAKRKRAPSDDESADERPPAKVQVAIDARPPCRYGVACYRTGNPTHCAEFSHPGDVSAGTAGGPDPVASASAAPAAASAAGATAASGSALMLAAPATLAAAAAPAARKALRHTTEIVLELHENYNEDITSLLEQLGAFQKSLGNGTKHKVYMKAATALQALPRRVTSGADARRLDGVGEKIAKKVDEILATGRLGSLERLQANEVTQAIHLFCSIDGIGPVLARRLADERGLRTLADLETVRDEFNTYQQVGLALHREFAQRIPRAEVEAIEAAALRVLPDIDPQLELTVCGSFRRGRPTCGDVDMLLSHPRYGSDRGSPGFLAQFAAALTRAGLMTHELGLGEHKCTAVCRLPTRAGEPPSVHRRVDILWIPWNEYPFALLYFTGSGFFNVQMRRIAIEQGYSLSEHGLVALGADGERDPAAAPVRVCSEREIFAFLGMKYRTPAERDLASTWKPTMS